MTTMMTDLYRSAGYHAGAAPGGALGRLIRRTILRAAERRSLTQLALLDDRLLRDVGLTRADVRKMTDGL
jgi:uncharacterized protein YjiS (DUF1127 family)